MSDEEVADNTTTTAEAEEVPGYQWDSAAQKEVKQHRSRLQKLDGNISKLQEKIETLQKELRNADQIAQDKMDDMDVRQEQAIKAKKKISRKMEKLFHAQGEIRQFEALKKKVEHNAGVITDLRAINKTLKKENKKMVKVYDDHVGKNEALMDTTSNLHNSFAALDERTETENERYHSLREDLAEEKAQNHALLEEVKTMDRHYNVMMQQRVECQTFMAQIIDDVQAEMKNRKLSNAITQIAINVQEDAEERMEKLKQKYETNDSEEEKKS